MITSEYCATMARYNEWMNSRLYALCATLPEAELRADRGAFFKSIYATLNHIAYADLAFLARFTGDPAVVPELDVALKAAEAICAFSGPSVRMAKEAVNRSFEMPLSDGIAFERHLFHSLFATDDKNEGMAAFLAKRKPEFKNR